MKVGTLIGLLVLSASAALAQKPFSPQRLQAASIRERTKDISAELPSSSSQLNPGGYVRPNERERFLRYLKRMFGPHAWAKSAFSSGYGTWRNSPREWGPTWEGFGRRFASSVGKTVISSTVTYGLEEAFALDSHFYRSQKKDIKSRLVNAIISPVTARDRTGKRVFGFPHIVGIYTANIVAAEAWYPSRYTYRNGLRSGTISLGTGALFNLAREFIHK